MMAAGWLKPPPRSWNGITVHEFYAMRAGPGLKYVNDDTVVHDEDMFIEERKKPLLRFALKSITAFSLMALSPIVLFARWGSVKVWYCQASLFGMALLEFCMVMAVMGAIPRLEKKRRQEHAPQTQLAHSGDEQTIYV
eukprot:TRINITY_DN71730_c0_g1_i1.p1 TRINITY_DN71730_c0_g1~~TRINITY_DN71730_c0_g1_i1.p1  ORF type:complete len:138 (-),score=15.93 TRINITY_DN71730_c0_g1_i1:36-449(-)